MSQRIYQYEALFLFGVAATTDVDGAIKTVENMIKNHGGEILLLRKWDERKLAYEIKKNKRGLYVLCFYKGPGSSVERITRDVNLSENILRVLVTDAAHLSLDEMKAMEPQQPVKEAPRRMFDEPVPAEASAL
jgi:small subunit ribosomal protein S6